MSVSITFHLGPLSSFSLARFLHLFACVCGAGYKLIDRIYTPCIDATREVTPLDGAVVPIVFHSRIPPPPLKQYGNQLIELYVHDRYNTA